MGKVVTFGEIMLRLAPQGFLRFSQANNFDVVYGGGESNVAVSLANYGVDVDFVTHHQMQVYTKRRLIVYFSDTGLLNI